MGVGIRGAKWQYCSLRTLRQRNQQLVQLQWWYNRCRWKPFEKKIHDVYPASRQSRGEKRGTEAGEVTDEPHVAATSTPPQGIQCAEDVRPGSSFEGNACSPSVAAEQVVEHGPKRRRSRGLQNDKNRADPITPGRTEALHQAVAKMIAVDQLPHSFVSSEGFTSFLERLCLDTRSAKKQR